MAKKKSKSKKSTSKKSTSKSTAKKASSPELRESPRSALSVVVGLLMWLTGVIVSLAIGFGMIDKTLTIMWINPAVTVFFGWVVVISTILSVIFAIARKFE